MQAALQITKAVDISVIPAPPGSIIPYKVDVKGSCLHYLPGSLLIGGRQTHSQRRREENAGIRQVGVPLRVLRNDTHPGGVLGILAGL
jgi:hypothetical protein